MPLYNPAFTASGNIKPARFVKISGEFTVDQCTDGTSGEGTPVIGVSQEGSFAPPGIAETMGSTPTYWAAPSGKTLKVFGLGDVCVVVAGASILAGNFVKSDSDGRAVPASSGDYSGGVALQSVASGEKCLIQVNPHKL
jgi:hypothetical protein